MYNKQKPPWWPLIALCLVGCSASEKEGADSAETATPGDVGAGDDAEGSTGDDGSGDTSGGSDDGGDDGDTSGSGDDGDDGGSGDGGDTSGSGDDGGGDDGTAEGGDDGAVDLNGRVPSSPAELPEFSATNYDGTGRAREDLLGHPTVMWFYPAAATAG